MWIKFCVQFAMKKLKENLNPPSESTFFKNEQLPLSRTLLDNDKCPEFEKTQIKKIKKKLR